MAKFPKTFCSQCGGEFGPGDHGYSHCDSHRQAAAIGRRGFASPTLFRFQVDYTENNDGRPYPAIRPEWAPNAATALAQAGLHLGGTRGFVSLDGIDPEPAHVKWEGETCAIDKLGGDERVLARAILAQQSGCETPIEMLAFLAANSESYAKGLMADWRDGEAEPVRHLQAAE